MSEETWNKILSGDLDARIKKGFRVIGQNTSDGHLSVWHSDDEAEAISFAETFADKTGGCYEVSKFEIVGVVRPKKFTEFIKLQ